MIMYGRKQPRTTFEAFDKIYNLESFSKDEETFLRLEMESIDFEAFFVQINDLEREFTKQSATKLDIEQELGQLKSNYDEGLKMRAIRKESVETLKEYLNTFSALDFYNIKDRSMWQNRIITMSI
ncbi:MAG: hypothetical protein FWE01_03040 [Firmicutes bacterium]|nr:hypothetical protein [Bacillota bacterium]